MTTRIAAILLFVSAFTSAPALADTVVLEASQDNTLYENGDGETSNAKGPTMFAGTTFQGFEDRRRAVMAFDLAGDIPPGSTITGVELRLYLSKVPISGPDPTVMNLHRLLNAWGEGTSAADATGGFGVAATVNDATWIHTFWNTSFWVTPGGDYLPGPSASTVVNDLGVYVWGSNPALVADVQLWLDSPGSNYGFILIGEESSAGSARRFNTRENPNVSTRPTLTIHYDPPFTPVRSTTWGAVKAQ
jgi:hypothetical protein